MRVLLTDKYDGSLVVAEISTARYNPDSEKLCFYAGANKFIIPGISEAKAAEFMTGLYSTGMIDLSEFEAIC